LFDTFASPFAELNHQLRDTFSRDKVRPLSSVVADLEAGVSVNSIECDRPLSSGEPCILKTSAIFDGKFDPEECKLIDRHDSIRARLSPRRDTIIVSRMNTPNLVGEVGYVPADFPSLNLPDRLWMTRFDSSAEICARWLSQMLSSNQVKGRIKELATGTSGSMKNIGKSVLLALQLKFPSGNEQTAIATILSDMDADITALETRRDKTRTLKQGMMQVLLTGQIRLV
jgi:restriction endonuclease S subunit